MIVSAVIRDQIIQADVPAGLEYKNAIYRPATDDYLIEFSEEQKEANRISPAQGRAQLHRDGKLSTIAQYIEQSDNDELKIFWEYSTFWDRTTQTLLALATAFQIDLDTFWSNAKSIEL